MDLSTAECCWKSLLVCVLIKILMAVIHWDNTNINSHVPAVLNVLYIISPPTRRKPIILILISCCQTGVKVTGYPAAVWSASRCSLLRINQRCNSVRAFRGIASYKWQLLWRTALAERYSWQGWLQQKGLCLRPALVIEKFPQFFASAIFDNISIISLETVRLWINRLSRWFIHYLWPELF